MTAKKDTSSKRKGLTEKELEEFGEKIDRMLINPKITIRKNPKTKKITTVKKDK